MALLSKTFALISREVSRTFESSRSYGAEVGLHQRRVDTSVDGCLRSTKCSSVRYIRTRDRDSYN